MDALREIARMERDFSKVDPKYLKYISIDYKRDRIDWLKKAAM